MATHVYVVKNKTVLSEENFQFLMQTVSPYRKERILCQHIKQKADMMLLGSAMAAFMLQKHFGIPVKKQEMGCGAYGKPYLLHFPNVHFSVSHSGKWAACAVSDVPVGIDIQEIRPFVPTVAQRVCNMEELAEIEKSADAASAFTRLWTRKEAVLKKYGTGILDGTITTCLQGEMVFSRQEEEYWVSVSESTGCKVPSEGI